MPSKISGDTHIGANSTGSGTTRLTEIEPHQLTRQIALAVREAASGRTNLPIVEAHSRAVVSSARTHVSKLKEIRSRAMQSRDARTPVSARLADRLPVMNAHAVPMSEAAKKGG